MNKLFAAVFASILAASSLCAFGAELTSEQSTELRQRAERLQVERARIPNPRSDDLRMPQRGDVRLDQNRGEVKTKVAKSKRAKTKSNVKKTKKKKRSLRELPGALVR